MKYGLLTRKQLNPQDDIFGGISRNMGQEKMNEKADWSEWLPTNEKQSSASWDSMSCVSFSALNCIEILQKYIWGDNVNYSDRALAKLSGTTQSGNYLHIVADTIRNQGLVDEEYWPFEGNSWAEYMREIPEEVTSKGEHFKAKYDVKYEFVQNRQIKDALKYAPLQTCVYAWPKKVNDIYPDVKGKPRNHAVTLIGYKENEYWLIFDHYDNFLKKIEWEYNFGGTLKFSIELKNNELPMIKNNSAVQLIDPPGGVGLYLDGKILVGTEGQVLWHWMMRNGNDFMTKKAVLHKVDWDKYAKFDFKGNKL